MEEMILKKKGQMIYFQQVSTSDIHTVNTNDRKKSILCQH